MKRKTQLILIMAMLGLGGCRDLFRDGESAYSGIIEMTEYSLGSRVPGRVVTLNVTDGDSVKKDQLLATLDHYEQAKRDYDRTVKLLSSGGATQQALEKAKLDLDDQQIVSPVDGVVLLKIHEVGEIVAAGSPILNVGESKKLWVRVYVPENRVARVKIDQTADIRVDGLDKIYKGRVGYVATKAEFTPRNVQTPEERITQTFAVKVFINEPDASLRPGVSADVILND